MFSIDFELKNFCLGCIFVIKWIKKDISISECGIYSIINVFIFMCFYVFLWSFIFEVKYNYFFFNGIILFFLIKFFCYL